VKTPVHVTVTGAAGQIGYCLLFRIGAGALFGPDQPVVLRLLEIEPAMSALEGVVMELQDCSFGLLAGIEATSDPKTAFDGTNWALLVGSVPRKEGMERNDLLNVNGGIFGPQGEAIAANAAHDVRVLVVGNPCNTNCLIARSHAPDVPDVRSVGIWGNHSSTQFPDFENAVIGGEPAAEVIGDDEWLRTEFITTVQQRGAAVLKARGAASAASAANAVIDSVTSIVNDTDSDAGDCESLAVVSHGEYGTPEGLIFGFPVRSKSGRVKIVEGLSHSEFARGLIGVTTDELLAEREAVRSLLS